MRSGIAYGEHGPLPQHGYYFRQNEEKYGGHIVAGIYHYGCEVQLWTYKPEDFLSDPQAYSAIATRPNGGSDADA